MKNYLLKHFVTVPESGLLCTNNLAGNPDLFFPKPAAKLPANNLKAMIPEKEAIHSSNQKNVYQNDNDNYDESRK